ncbi:MAG: cytochrome c peroxidase, partial [Bacteroidota bacterium]
MPDTDQIDRELRNAIHQASPEWKYTDYIFPDPGDLARIPQDPRNPLTPEKVQLGRWLYHETGLAKVAVREEGMLTYSCASCHLAKAGFQANRRQGIGEGGLGFGIAGEGRQKDLRYEDLELDVQPIRSPSALNVAYQEVMLWNGQFGATGPNAGTEAKWTEGTPKAVNHLGYQGVETQAIAGLTVHRMQVDSALVAELGYKFYFDRSFPKFPQHNRYSLETAGLAIAAYERTLMPQNAPFQNWLKGERDAMTYRQKYGALLFFSQAGCVNCHQGPAMSGPGFYALGMPDLSGPDVFNVTLGDDAHLGRGGFTGNPE